MLAKLTSERNKWSENWSESIKIYICFRIGFSADEWYYKVQVLLMSPSISQIRWDWNLSLCSVRVNIFFSIILSLALLCAIVLKLSFLRYYYIEYTIIIIFSLSLSLSPHFSLYLAGIL